MARTITSADYFEAASAVVTAAPFTVNVWFNAADITNFAFLFSLADASGSHFWQLICAGHVGGDPVRWVAGGAATGTASSATGFSAGTWHMATGIEVGTATRGAMIDGADIGSDGTSVTPAGIDTTSVGRRGTSTPVASGQDVDIAEVAVWSTNLTQDEIGLLYHAGPTGISPLFVRPEYLIHYWRCLEQAITDDLQDIVGGVDLTQTSSPAVAVHPPVIYPMPQRTAFEVTAVGGSAIPALDEGMLTGGMLPMSGGVD